MPSVAFFVAVLVLAACSGGARMARAAEPLELDTQLLEFGRIYAGTTTIRGLRIRNQGPLALVVRLRATGPFTAPSAVAVRSGELVVVDARFVPGAVGRAEGSLEVLAAGQRLLVRLTGTAVAPPECEPAGPCEERSFDAQAGACLTRPAHEGDACASACLVGAVCRAGACVGSPAACDDGDACTADACDLQRGCVHQPVACSAPTELCRVAACDPARGCGSADAPDGTACGPADCTTASVCLAGKCSRVAVPEGAACAPATPCQAAGSCHAGRCVRPPASPLVPRWSIDAPAGTVLRFPGLADEAGNVDWLECDGARCALASATPDGLLRFRAPLGLGPAEVEVGSGALLTQGLVVIAGGGRAEARRQADGSQAWLSELAPGGHSTEPVALSDGTVAVAATAPGESSSTLFLLRPSDGVARASPLPLDAEFLLGTGGVQLEAYGQGPQGPARALLDASNLEATLEAFPQARPLGAFAGWQLLVVDAQVAFAWPDGGLASPSAALWAGGASLEALPPLASTAAGFLFGSRRTCASGAACPLVIGFEPGLGESRWAEELSTLPEGTRFAQPVLASDGQALVTTTTPDARRALHAFAPGGAPRFHCALPEGQPLGGATLVGQRWIEGVACDGGARVQAFDMPGLEESADGWAADRGGSSRRGTP